MSIDLKSLIELLNKQGKMRFIEPATKAQIEQFESNHDIQFPSKFKEWLLFSDGGELFIPAGLQFYGVAHEPLISVDDEDRPDDSYIVIGALASGDPILMKKGEERIAIFNHEAGIIEKDEVYDDFFSFLEDAYNFLGLGE